MITYQYKKRGELLDQRFQVLASTQDLRHSMRKFVKLAGDYLGEESPLCLSMKMWPRHIDRFERQYNQSFARDPLFGAGFMDRIHKRVQVFLHSCNTASIEDVELGPLPSSGGFRKRWGEGSG